MHPVVATPTFLAAVCCCVPCFVPLSASAAAIDVPVSCGMPTSFNLVQCVGVHGQPQVSRFLLLRIFLGDCCFCTLFRTSCNCCRSVPFLYLSKTPIILNRCPWLSPALNISVYPFFYFPKHVLYIMRCSWPAPSKPLPTVYLSW